MNPALYFQTLSSLPLAEDGPGADPFSGISTPFLTIVIVLAVIMLVWWLLRAQTSQVDEVHVDHDDHDHGHDGHGHDDHGEPETAAMAEPGPEAHDAEAMAEPVAEEYSPPVEVDAPPAVRAQGEPDDLKKLEGIGPKVEEVLNRAGIATYEQLAGAEVEHLQNLLDAAEYQYMNPGSWPEQARLAAAGDWDALQKLQDELTAGK